MLILIVGNKFNGAKVTKTEKELDDIVWQDRKGMLWPWKKRTSLLSSVVQCVIDTEWTANLTFNPLDS